MRHNPPAFLPVACGALLVFTGCTGESSTKSAAPHSGTSSPSFDARPAHPVELGCDDAGSGEEPSGAGSLTSAGLTLEGLAQPTTQVPSATQQGLLVPAGSSQHFRKAPAYLAAGAGPVTIELLEPAPGHALAWVPASDWSGRPDLRPWMTTTVTLDGCPDRDVTYFGGVMANRSDACLDLRVKPADGPERDTPRQLNGDPC